MTLSDLGYPNPTFQHGTSLRRSFLIIRIKTKLTSRHSSNTFQGRERRQPRVRKAGLRYRLKCYIRILGPLAVGS